MHPRLECTALDHEAINHTMKNGTVVVPLIDVLQKVGAGLWSVLLIESDDHISLAGGETNFHCGGSFAWTDLMMMGVFGTSLYCPDRPVATD